MRNRDRKGFGGRFAVLQHEVGVRSRENAECARAMHLIAIDADVAKAGHRVARVMTAEREKRAAVEIIEARRGKIEDVDVIALENNLVARAAVDGNRRQRLAHPPIPLAVNFLLIALHRQGVTFARGQRIYENRNIFAAGVLEQQCRAAASQARDADCAQLLIQVDRHAHAGQLAFSVEQINKFSQASKSHADLLMSRMAAMVRSYPTRGSGSPSSASVTGNSLGVLRWVRTNGGDLIHGAFSVHAEPVEAFRNY